MRWSNVWVLIFALMIIACSKFEDKIKNTLRSPKKDLITTPSGGLYKSEEEWRESDDTKYGDKEYLRLHARPIRSAQDWKNYVLAIFPEAREAPPKSLKPFPWALNERSFVLYFDFLNTGKPTAVFFETMPTSPRIRTLVVSEWGKSQWNELLRIDENGGKTPYVSSVDPNYDPSEKFNGFTIMIYEDDRPNGKKYFDFNRGDIVSWHLDLQRYCFSDPMGPGETFESMKEFEESIICDQEDMDRLFPPPNQSKN
ncbi:MAG: hypothetical protein HY547_02665 [Elusimicrobia bacterium]|nr:hypothetical protein [Elusimicrobiota bacterium]